MSATTELIAGLFESPELFTSDPDDVRRAKTYKRQSPVLYVMSAMLSIIFLLAAIAELILLDGRPLGTLGAIYSLFFTIVMVVTFFIIVMMLTIAITRSRALHNYEDAVEKKPRRQEAR